jgi:hypothetical protein
MGVWIPDDVVDDAAAELLADRLGAPVVTWGPHWGPNGFPALPVRDDRAAVWLATFDNPAARGDALARLHSTSARQDEQVLMLTRAAH